MKNADKRAQRAEDFKNQKIKSAKDFNFDQHNRKGVEGTHVSGQEVRHLRQREGGNRKETYAALQAQQEAGATFGKKAQRQMDNMGQRIDKIDARRAAKEKAKAVKDQQPESTNTTPTNNTSQAVTNTQEQNVNQNNDINNNVSGDGNYINNNQDNSVRNYGGDNRSLVINSNGANSVTEAVDGAGTAGTLAGIWDADDSPAAQAKRIDFHQTMNRDAQKQYADTSHIAQGAVARAENNSYIDPAALDKRIQERSQYHKAQATVKGGQIFGDLFGMNAPTWNSADPAKPVEKPDFEKLSDTYTDF